MNKVELLWLWYDYHTERFDQFLGGIPSPNDEGSIIVVGHHRGLSNKHAHSLQKQIYAIADYYGIAKEAMSEERRYRNRQTTRRRIELYEWVIKNIPHELNFIDDYNERVKQEEQLKIEKSGICDLLKIEF